MNFSFNFGIEEMIRVIRKYFGPPLDSFFVAFVISIIITAMLRFVVGIESHIFLLFITIFHALLIATVLNLPISSKVKWIAIVVSEVAGLLFASVRAFF